jgi:hypothetical protein
MGEISEQSRGRCSIDTNTRLFSCIVPSNDVNQFLPLDFTVKPGFTYSIKPEFYITMVPYEGPICRLKKEASTKPISR